MNKEGVLLEGGRISGTFSIHTAKGLAGAYGVDVFVTLVRTQQYSVLDGYRREPGRECHRCD